MLIASSYFSTLFAQGNSTLPTGSFKMQGMIGEPNIESSGQKPQVLMVADVSKEQIKKECSFFGGDSLNGFDFDNAAKQALLEGDKIYLEFKTFMFENQAEFVKKKYHIKALPFEIEEANRIITPPFLLSSPCNNIDFENGNLTGWVTSRGYNRNSNGPLRIMASPAYSSTNQSIHSCNDLNIMSSAFPADPYTNASVPGLDPQGGNFSLRVGGEDINTAIGYGFLCDNVKYGGHSNGEKLSQTFVVTAANDLISFDYAVVLNDGGHPFGQQPYFNVSISNLSGQALDTFCTKYYVQVVNSVRPPGFLTSSLTGPYSGAVYYLPWQSNSIYLGSYIGQTVVLSFTAAGCTQGAHFGYAYVDASCGPAQITANAVCGGTTATLSAPPSQGGSYSWSGPTGGIISASTTAQTVVVGIAGAYSVTITPPQGTNCKYTLTTTVGFSTMTSNIATSANIACKGVNSGSASVNTTGGLPSFTYLWSPSGQTTSAATGLSAGTYTVLVTDAGGCTHSNTVAITQPSKILKDTIASFSQSTCLTPTGSAKDSTFGGTPGYTYLWTPGGQTTAIATGLSSGTYSVHVTDANGCPSTSSVTITIPAANGPTVTPTISSNVLCNGGNNGSAIANISGGLAPYTYSWSSGQTTSAVTGLSSGSYTVSVTDANSCSFVTILSITQPSVLSTPITPTDIQCNGLTNGSAIVHPSGGTTPYTYSWNSSPAQTTQTASNLAAGPLTVSVTDSHGCISTQSVTISEPAAMSIGITQTPAHCYGDSTGSATVTGVTGGYTPYTYSWITNPVQTGTSAVNLPAGTYSVQVTDKAGCHATQTIVVTQPNQITFNISHQGYGCGSVGLGTISVTSVGGGFFPYNYSWSNGDSVPTISNLLNGTYLVNVIDAQGCIAHGSATIPAKPVPTNTAVISNVSCNGFTDGSIIANASGGTGPLTYLWLPSGQTTPAITGLLAGTYTISVVDSLGCFFTNTVLVTQPAVLSTSITSTSPCIGLTNGIATANTSGGTTPYSYLWNTTPPQNTLSANNIGAGTYSVLVTDAHNCPTTQTITITDPTDIIAAISPTPDKCNGDNTGSANVTSTSGGFPPYTYTWNTNPPQNGTIASGLSAGTYSVLITDAHGCHPLTSQTITIYEPNAIVYTATWSGYNCGPTANAAASVSGITGGTPPYTYSWSNGATTTIISNLVSGSYIVSVKDAHGCIVQQNVTIPASTQPHAGFSTTQTPSCEGITVQFLSSSLQATGYSWNFGDGNTSTVQNPTNLYPPVGGTFVVTLVAANPPCKDTLTYPLVVGDMYPSNVGSVNVFTPNGDGNNDCFTLAPYNAYAITQCLSLEIFDRWGVKIFESSDTKKCWDGNTKNGSLAKEGTYFYIAKLGGSTIKGYVELMR